MKIAIPVYGDCVSNVFDFAHRLLLVDIENGKETNRSEIAMENKFLLQRAVQLKALGADVLVCGAISQELEAVVLSSGIAVFPFVVGHVEEVLGAYKAGRLMAPKFNASACRYAVRKGLRHRNRGCRWPHVSSQK